MGGLISLLKKSYNILQMEDNNPAPQTVVQPLTPTTGGKPLVFGAVFVLLIVISGVATGFGLSKLADGSNGLPVVNGKTAQVIKTEIEEGVVDASAYPDTATGEVKANDGKLTTEGSHILIRPGGVTQNVYLVSSIVNLENYVGKSVQIWGQTFKGQKAGWLMDVGKIKVQ
jgi:hypothetical protein